MAVNRSARSAGTPWVHRLFLLAQLLLLLQLCGGIHAQVLLNATEQLQPLADMGLLQIPFNSTCNCSCLSMNSGQRTSEGVLLSPQVNVTCDESQLNVTAVTVTRLDGPIPSSISSLWALTSLSMSQANVTGTIPSELGLLADLVSLDLSRNRLNGSLPDTLFSIVSLASLNLQDNSLSGDVIPQVGQLAALTRLDLGGNSFSGAILASLAPLANLTYLNISGAPLSSFEEFEEPMSSTGYAKVETFDMSHIGVNGTLDSFPWKELSSLRVLNMTNLTVPPADQQKLKLQLPEDLGDLSMLQVLLYDNATLPCPSQPPCKNYSSLFCNLCRCSCPVDTRIIVGSVIGGAVVLLLVLFLLFFLLREREYHMGVKVEGVRCYTAKELEQATEGYKTKLGEGGFGVVYKGTLPGGVEVAVKRAEAKKREKKVREFDSTFRNEILVLSRVKHGNLVRLLGYGLNKTDLQLVYEFAAHGSLYDVLHADDGQGLTWARRLGIAHGAAQGLSYLHSMAGADRIIHLDIKTQNILVDAAWNAKVADFGLSKTRPEGWELEAHTNTVPRGTRGYIDPAYAKSGGGTTASDTYSFGVVLLEVATGWEPVAKGKLGYTHIKTRVAMALKDQGLEGVVARALRPELGLEVLPYGGSSEGRMSDSRSWQSKQGSTTLSTGEQLKSSIDMVDVNAGGGHSAGAGMSAGTSAAAAAESTSGVSGPPLNSLRVQGDGNELEQDEMMMMMTAVQCAQPSMSLFRRLVQLGWQCCSNEPAARPSMLEVARVLGDLLLGRAEEAPDLDLESLQDMEEYMGDNATASVYTQTVGGTMGAVSYVIQSGLNTMK